MDAYRHGLDGSQAAWINRHYHGHRTFPHSLLEALDHVKNGKQDEAAHLLKEHRKAEAA